MSFGHSIHELPKGCLTAGAPLFVGTDLRKEYGGPVNTIGRFQEALGGDVVSFSRSKLIPQRTPNQENVTHIPVASNQLGRSFSYANPDTLRKIDQLVSRATVLSCHGIFRYHNNWVARQSTANSKPYWIVPHGSLDPWVFTYRRWMKMAWWKLCGRRILNNAAAVIFATKREQEKAQHLYRGKNSFVIPWPVSPIPSVGQAAIADFREELNIQHGDRVLLFLGRLHSMKQPLETMRAFAQAKLDNCHLVVAGCDGDISVTQAEAYATQLNAQNIHVVGPAWGREKHRLFNACDGFILLSHRENFGHSVAEAMSAAKPVIVSAGVDLMHDFGNARAGWIVDPKNRQQVAQAIMEFSQLPTSNLRNLGATGQRLIQAYSFDTFKFHLCSLHQRSIESIKS